MSDTGKSPDLHVTNVQTSLHDKFQYLDLGIYSKEYCVKFYIRSNVVKRNEMILE